MKVYLNLIYKTHITTHMYLKKKKKKKGRNGQAANAGRG